MIRREPLYPEERKNKSKTKSTSFWARWSCYTYTTVLPNNDTWEYSHVNITTNLAKYGFQIQHLFLLQSTLQHITCLIHHALWSRSDGREIIAFEEIWTTDTFFGKCTTTCRNYGTTYRRGISGDRLVGVALPGWEVYGRVHGENRHRPVYFAYNHSRMIAVGWDGMGENGRLAGWPTQCVQIIHSTDVHSFNVKYWQVRTPSHVSVLLLSCHVP